MPEPEDLRTSIVSASGPQSSGGGQISVHSTNVDKVFKELTTAIDEGRITLYRDRGHPCVRCPRVGGATDPERQKRHLRLFSWECRCWLRLFATRANATLSTEGVKQVLDLLAGLSLETDSTVISDRELLDLLQGEPAFASVVEFMAIQETSPFEETTEAFYKRLTNFAKERGLLIRGRKRFPGGANVLSRFIRQNLDLFEAAGIRIQLRRSNGRRPRGWSSWTLPASVSLMRRRTVWLTSMLPVGTHISRAW